MTQCIMNSSVSRDLCYKEVLVISPTYLGKNERNFDTLCLINNRLVSLDYRYIFINVSKLFLYLTKKKAAVLNLQPTWKYRLVLLGAIIYVDTYRAYCCYFNSTIGRCAINGKCLIKVITILSGSECQADGSTKCSDKYLAKITVVFQKALRFRWSCYFLCENNDIHISRNNT